MRKFRQLIALILSVAWCFATGHLWSAHAGEPLAIHPVPHTHAADSHDHDHQDGDHGEDRDCPADPSHHHHVMGEAARVSANPSLIFAAPFVAFLWENIVLVPDRELSSEIVSGNFGSPPDQRISGHLLATQTAHPVRGPSRPA